VACRGLYLRLEPGAPSLLLLEGSLVTLPIASPVEWVSREQLRDLTLQDWYQAVFNRPLMPYQLEMVRRVQQAGSEPGRMVFLPPSRQLGWSTFRNQLANLWARNTYLSEHGEPWALAMRAPSHARLNPINRALRALYQKAPT